MADDGDEFAAFVRSHARQLQRVAWLLTGDWGRAEDLVQTALTRTWQHWSAIREPSARAAYTRKVLLTTFLSWRRRRRFAEVSLADVSLHPAVDDPSTDVADRAAVLAALGRLPRQQRAVVVLRYFDDLPERAVAEALGCGVGTVKSQNSRAIRTLRADPNLAILFAEGRR